ncbi:putative bifunctional diguanylate cyclase/phosphodiesterase [Aquabacterium humicola]|uniref:putative bifunctional diguanylate cyclase/phosphodiesterase n=1 Tax=Aquabacterium humicola TaxID=3237377 RepID=UPI002543BD2A|nr:bifunctional diguanylate cyclase/phosphodiesterase [Rubrivivax pictus]
MNLLSAWAQTIDALGDAAWLVDGASAHVLAANAAAVELLGLPLERLLGCNAAHLIATPEDLAFWDEVRAGHDQWLQSDTVLVHASGRLVKVSRRVRLLDPAQRCFLVTVQDRTEAQRRCDERESLVAELRATLESTGDGILVTDLAGRITAFNRRFAQLWGVPEELLTQRNDEAVYDWMRRSVREPEAYQRRLAVIQEATLMQAHERIELLSGRVLERVTQPQSCHGRPNGRVWAFRDRTELETASQRINTLSTTDGLTGLFNRRQLGETLAESMRQAHRASGTLALLILDLDRFKQINDSLGHEIGDRVLLDTAERLKSCLRQGDFVARIGGDQFALVVQRVDHRGAEAAAQRVLEAISRPCSVDGLQFTMTCSVGVALFPTDGEDGDELVRHAETAMQRAKQGGRAGFRFHQPHHDADLRQRMRLDHAMRQALASNRFRLKYQPQLDLRSGAVIGAEALIRWRDPELGEVSPGEFIPVAEDTGFIVAIGDWVLQQAVRQAARWRNEGLVMPVSVNVSALQFQQADFIDRVAAVLSDNELPGSLLELELTESILVHDADEALARLSQLSQLGVRLAIDDFGTGYSSLSYLKRFPIERLKIDRSFIEGIPQNDSDAGIVRAIVQMSAALGMKVIAEGVETEPQRNFLVEVGCDQFQGFLYAPALDALSFDERVRGRPRGGAKPQLSLVAR